MESYKDVNKQLWGLVQGIKQCNFIPYEDRKDIVQDSFLKIVEKINQGVLADDITKSRGYIFSILRNFCLAYQNKRIKENSNYSIIEDITKQEEEDTEYQEMIREKVLNYSKNKDFSNIDRKFLNMTLSGCSKLEVMEELNLTSREVGSLQTSVGKRIKTKISKVPRYYIRKLDEPRLNIPCFTYNDIRRYFPQKTSRQLNYALETSKSFDNNYYIVRSE